MYVTNFFKNALACTPGCIHGYTHVCIYFLTYEKIIYTEGGVYVDTHPSVPMLFHKKATQCRIGSPTMRNNGEKQKKTGNSA